MMRDGAFLSSLGRKLNKAAKTMASEDIAKLAESLARTQVGGGQLSFKGKSLKLNTAEDGETLPLPNLQRYSLLSLHGIPGGAGS